MGAVMVLSRCRHMCEQERRTTASSRVAIWKEKQVYAYHWAIDHKGHCAVVIGMRSSCAVGNPCCNHQDWCFSSPLLRVLIGGYCSEMRDVVVTTAALRGRRASVRT